jgi:hypothetical protein
VAMPEQNEKPEPQNGYDNDAWREDYIARRDLLTKK